jgi:hypothetical protein
LVMGVAEQFSHLPFLTIVHAVHLAAERWDAADDAPSDAALSRVVVESLRRQFAVPAGLDDSVTRQVRCQVDGCERVATVDVMWRGDAAWSPGFARTCRTHSVTATARSDPPGNSASAGAG